MIRRERNDRPTPSELEAGKRTHQHDNDNKKLSSSKSSFGLIALILFAATCILFSVNHKTGFLSSLVLIRGETAPTTSIPVIVLPPIVQKVAVFGESEGGGAGKNGGEEEEEKALAVPSKSDYKSLLHLSHVPKCGGTSLSTVLRRASCEILTSRQESDAMTSIFEKDPMERTSQCCVNPGYCEPNDKKGCPAISGCSSHNPNLNQVATSEYGGYTMLRDPVARVRSAFHYHCHNPNGDCYLTRPEYCQVAEAQSRECGVKYDGRSLAQIKDDRPSKRPVKSKIPDDDEWRSKVWSFDEYLLIPEYNNVYTRMFGTAPRTNGKGGFPYKANLELTVEDLERAKVVLSKYSFVGVLELYELSIALTLKTLGVELVEDVDFLHERSKGESNERIALKKRVDSESGLIDKIKAANSLDMELFDWVLQRFCSTVRKGGVDSDALIKRLEDGGNFKRSKYDKMCPK
jgi:hypothetical protein